MIELALASRQSVTEVLQWDDKLIATVADIIETRNDAIRDANRRASR